MAPIAAGADSPGAVPQIGFHMRKAIRLLPPVCLGAAIFLMPATALAQSHPCRGAPGERQVGMAPAGIGFAPFPICITEPAPRGNPSGNEARGDAASPYDNMLDAMTRNVIAQHQRLTAAQGIAAIEQQMARDPALRRMQIGAWEFFQADPKAQPGETCTAVWMKQGQLVGISGPGPKYDGGMLSFWSADIPRPRDMQTITITMKQSRYPAQTVKAVNYTIPGHDFGAISLMVPDIDKAIDTMLDVEHFEVLIDGKTVSDIGWGGGHDAREKLRRCVHPG